MIISIDPDAVLEAAHLVDVSRRRGRRLGPRAGRPLLVKDNIDTNALPTTAGTPGLLSNRPRADAPVPNPLFQAGALLFAKANMLAGPARGSPPGCARPAWARTRASG